MEKQFLNPKGLIDTPAFSEVATVRGGAKTIYISGQVAMGADMKLVGKGDIRAQTTKVFENLKTALEAVGATFEDVIKVNYYIVSYKPEMLVPIREARSEFLSKKNPPASTLVGVEALFQPDVLIEVEAIAVVE